MINNTKTQLQQQEQLVQNKLQQLDNYIECLLGNNASSVQEIDENVFPNEVCKDLTCANTALLKFKNQLSEEKQDVKDFSSEVCGAITSIANIKNSINNAQAKLIYAQNKCALNGDIINADKLAKISFELNYQNHMFVKNASSNVYDLKQIIKE